MGITRARRDCSCPSRKGRRWSCWLKALSANCARGPRRPRSFPLYTSSPRRRSERRASKSGQALQADGGYCDRGRRTAARAARNLAQRAAFASFQYIGTAEPTVSIWLVERRPWRRPATTPRAAVGGKRTRTSPVTLLPYFHIMGTRPRNEPSRWLFLVHIHRTFVYFALQISTIGHA